MHRNQLFSGNFHPSSKLKEFPLFPYGSWKALMGIPSTSFIFVSGEMAGGISRIPLPRFEKITSQAKLNPITLAIHFSSKLIEKAVEELATLPGIGPKTALRLALQLLKMDKERVDRFTQAISDMRHRVRYCQQCHQVSDEEICAICANPHRQADQICVVESIRDLLAIESTRQYQGVYHVLGGILSPLNGIGPDQIQAESLIRRLRALESGEVIMALSPTMEGDTTVYYLVRQCAELPVRFTTIARGIAFGGELEFADETTLARSLSKRLPLENYLSLKD